jgi:hypothetical protein
LENPKGGDFLPRPMHKCDDIIKVYLREVCCEGVNQIELAHIAQGKPFVDIVMNLWVP